MSFVTNPPGVCSPAPRLRTLFAACALAAIAGGCQRSPAETQSRADAQPQNDNEDVPISEGDVPLPADYNEAVERLAGYCQAIREAIASGQPADAHRPLDESNIAIDRLPDVARTSGVPRRFWEQIVTASEDLAEALGEIHNQIDAHRTPDYQAHAKTIDNALAALTAVARESESNAERTDDEKAKP